MQLSTRPESGASLSAGAGNGGSRSWMYRTGTTIMTLSEPGVVDDVDDNDVDVGDDAFDGHDEASPLSFALR